MRHEVPFKFETPMKRLSFLFAVCIFSCMELAGQSEYLVGASTVSIEPGPAIFSTALAGYGLPRDGRFSITWKPVGDIRSVKDAVAGKLSWAKKTHLPKQMGTTVDVVIHRGVLYALNSGDSLLMGTPHDEDTTWTLIGRNNSETFDLDIERIAIADDRLYALSTGKKLYISEHSTDGNLSVGCITVKRGTGTVVIVSADLCGFDYAFTYSIREAIAARHNIPMPAIMTSVTHTHFSPVTQEWPTLGPFYGEPNQQYMELLRCSILQSVELALASMKPSHLFFGRGATNIGINRRLSVKPDAPYDNTLDILAVRDADNRISEV